ncbi:MAG: GH1 family beta-glucosidase [Myxococcota bacterium]
MNFPAQFVWGAATSSYQVEGAALLDGRGPSIWDIFSSRPGAVKDGSTGAFACDHYHRYPEDVALLRALGIRSYRFSIAWPRILPLGRGRVEPRGLDFYDRLVDALLAAGIEPCATLYHWDLPQALQDAGGWPLRATAEAFVPFVDVVTRRLGDRVKRWITHNEPWCASMLGHLTGEHAPGLRDGRKALAAAHHLLLSHGLAVPVVRANVRDADVGITLNLTPAEATPGHEEEARRFDGWFNRWFLDPVFGRGYPADVVADRVADGHWSDFVREGDLETIAAPIDFLGLNYYTRATFGDVPARERTDIGWEIDPGAFERLLVRVHREYGPRRVFVTENGAAVHDGPGPDGRVHDARRVAYLRDHLAAVARAIAAGVPVAGYYVWSLLDNFEWAHGYAQRFGIVWVDYATQARVPKDSAWFYRDVVAANAVSET